MPWRHRRRSRASQREGVQAGGVRGARRAGGDWGGGDESRRIGHEEEKQCRSSHGCVACSLFVDRASVCSLVVDFCTNERVGEGQGE